MVTDAVVPQEDTRELRREIIDACHTLCELDHFIGTWGNISVRIERGLLVTPSRLDYYALEPDDMVTVSMDGARLGGHRVPSSETLLHATLLDRRPDVGAIIHAHSPYLSSISAASRSLPVVAEDMAQIIGGEVQCARYARGGNHRELAAVACEAMGDTCMAALLANHGVVVGGRTLAEAVVATRVLEKAALMFICSMPLGGCVTIPPEAAAEERERYLHHYGREDVTSIG